VAGFAACDPPIWLAVTSTSLDDAMRARTRFSQFAFSNESRARLVFAIDALGCVCSLRARSALDGVSWVQGG
jgi:hypothetical protein